MQVQDLLNRALKICGVLAAGETPAAEESADALASLNSMLANWSLERLNIYGLVREVQPLSQGVPSYTVGPGGSWNIPRPLAIAAMNAVASGFTFSMEPQTAKQWGELQEKGSTAIAPERYYSDDAYPQATIFVHPTPAQGGVSVEIFFWQQLPSYVTITDNFDLPPGYEEAIRYNLAVRLAPEFGMQTDPTTAAIAAETKNALRSLNAPPFAGAAQEGALAATVQMASSPQLQQQQSQQSQR